MILTLANINFKVKADEIIYEGDDFEVEVQEFESKFKGVWVSSLVGFPSFSTIKSYKSSIIQVLNNMQKYGYNVMVFHVRIYNDALYESNYCNHSRYYNNDTGWEAVEWIIEECHARGIEFHAWMNPYRCDTSTGLTANQVANKFPAFNAAHDPNNLLKGNDYWLMDPGIPEVQEFIVKVVEEFINKFDCDAIHFDDYFYNSGVDDTKTYEKYKEGNESKTTFRQNSVTKMIKNLHEMIDKYNKENNKAIKLGISPTPTYRSGDGVVTYDSNGHAITTGANISSYYDNHYNSACADTLLWIQKGYIDYIVPQMYYDDIRFYANCPWWDAIIKNEDCLYVAGLSLSDIRWDYLDACNNLSGICLFTHRDLEKLAKTEEGKNYLSGVNMPYKYNKNPVLMENSPEFSIIYQENKYKIAVKNNDDLTNWYLIYRNTNKLDFKTSEFIGILNAGDIGSYSVYEDNVEENENYVYGVCAISKSFHYSKGNAKSVKHNESSLVTFISPDNEIIGYDVYNDISSIIYPNITVEEGKMIIWDEIYDENSKLIELKAQIQDKTYKIDYVDPDGNVIYTENHKYGDSLTAPDLPESPKYNYTKWLIDRNYKVKNDDTIYLKYSLISYKINIYNYYDALIQKVTCNYDDKIELPTPIEVPGYIFVNWNHDDICTGNCDIKPIYEKIKYNITITNESGDIILTDTVEYGDNYIINADILSLYDFTNDDLSLLNNIKSDINITVKTKSEDVDPVEPVIEPENDENEPKNDENSEKKTGCNQSMAKIWSNFVLFGACLIILIKKKH